MISGVILAAGDSKRMGQPKMLLPWGSLTVIEHVVSTFLRAGIEDLVVITGGAHQQVAESLDRLSVRKIYNEEYAAGEMLSSLQWGIRHLGESTQAALIGLGDQPQVQESTIRAICKTYTESGSNLIVPSFERRRGHPWLVARSLWHELLTLQPTQSPRDFLNSHSAHIHYVDIDTPTILADLDTPDDYQRAHP